MGRSSSLATLALVLLLQLWSAQPLALHRPHGGRTAVPAWGLRVPMTPADTRLGSPGLGLQRLDTRLAAAADEDATAGEDVAAEAGAEEAPLTYGDLEAGDWLEVTTDAVTLWHPVPYRKTGVNPKGWVGVYCKAKGPRWPMPYGDALVTPNTPLMIQFYEPCKCVCHFSLDEVRLQRKGDEESRKLVPRRKV